MSYFKTGSEFIVFSEVISVLSMPRLTDCDKIEHSLVMCSHIVQNLQTITETRNNEVEIDEY